MVKNLFMTGLVCYLAVSSMDCTYKQENLPVRPGHVRGWQEKVFDGVHSLAELILDQSQSSESGEFGVEVVSISPYETRGSPFDRPTGPEAVLRFYRLPDHQVIQETTVFMGVRI